MRFPPFLAAAFLTSLILGCATASPPERSRPLLLTYVANEGVLLSTGDHKVLIDALFDKPNPEYRAPAPDVLDRIMKGAPPYDGIDLVLVTHNHPDHFDASLAARYLTAVSGPLLAAPADAVAELKKTPEWSRIESRVTPLDVEVGKREQRDLGGIRFTAARTLHSGNRESPMNLTLLLTLDGWRIFHEGDSPAYEEKCGSFALDEAPVDLALVHFWFPLQPDCAEFLAGLAPEHIALMHLPVAGEGEWGARIDRVRSSFKDMFLMTPGMEDKVFVRPGRL